MQLTCNPIKNEKFMQKIFVYSMFLLLSLTLTNCKKKEASDTLTASINGVKFSANSVIAIVSSGRFSIDASTSSGQSIEIDVEGLTPGTTSYTLDSGNTAGSKAFYTLSSAYSATINKTGSVVVNITGNRVSGTFNFTLSDGTVISNGVYNSATF